MNKRFVFSLCILFMSFNVFAMTKTDKNFSEYDCFVLQKNDFPKMSNYDEIMKKGKEIYFYYKIDTLEKKAFITEFYYVLRGPNNVRYLLGGFNLKDGFINDKGINTFESESEIEWRKKYIIGISLSVFRGPFFVHGVAKSTDNDIYETEILKYLYINDSTMSLDKYTPY